MNKNPFRSLSILWFLTLAACTSTARPCEPRLCPEVHLTMGAQGETVILFGVCNIGIADFAGDPHFSGELRLYDETGTLLGLRTHESLGPVAVQEMVLPGQFTIDLLPGGYHLTYYSETCGFTEADFYVAEQDGVRWLKTPLLFDPLGASRVSHSD